MGGWGEDVNCIQKMMQKLENHCAHLLLPVFAVFAWWVYNMVYAVVSTVAQSSTMQRQH